MTDTAQQSTATELWDIVKKEITGIQYLWETVSGLHFQPLGKGLGRLESDIPLVYGLMQTALMESLLMRVSRLLDPAVTGKGQGQKENLSLKRLVILAPAIAADEGGVRNTWDGSELKAVRDKYLSHNDLNRSLTQEHTLNIPLTAADIAALQTLVEGLRELRRNVNHKLLGVPHLDQSADLHVQRELGILDKALLGGELFFRLLPDHDCLQQALCEVGHG